MLAPERKRTLDQLNSLIVANAAALGWARAINGTVLPVPSDNEISWYPEIDAKLAPMRDDAERWLNGEGPQLYARCLQSYVAYNNLFAAITPKIKELVVAAQARGGAPSEGERKMLGSLFNELRDEASSQRDNIRHHRDALMEFQDTMRHHAATLKPLLGSAADRSQKEQQQIEVLKGKIATIRERISSLVTQEESAKFSNMTGTANLIWMMTFGLVKAAGALAFSGVFTVASFGYSIYKVDKATKEMNKCVHEINGLLKDIGPSSIKIIVLGEVTDMLSNLAQQSDQAMIGIASVDGIWDQMTEKLSMFIEVLAQPIQNIGAFSDLKNLEFAQKVWADVAQYAGELQEMQIEVQQERAA